MMLLLLRQMGVAERDLINKLSKHWEHLHRQTAEPEEKNRFNHDVVHEQLTQGRAPSHEEDSKERT